MSLRGVRTLVIAMVAATLGTVLQAGAAASADDPPRYVPYYGIFTRGAAKIPYLDTTPYVPQGLAYWPERDEMVVSYYDDNGGRARLTFLDRTSSARSKSVFLDAKIHAATLTMSENYLWVSATTSSATQVIRYAKTALSAAADGAEVKRNKVYPLKASSYLEVEGSRMYVGSFHTDGNGTVYRYPLNANEDLAAAPDHSFTAPSRIQGMAITSTHFIWSRSYGRNNDSELAVDPRQGAITKRLVTPNMSEDLAIVDGQVYAVYESGAQKYSDADYKVRTVHHGSVVKLVG